MRLAIAMSAIGLACMAQTTTPRKATNFTSKPAPAAKPKPGVVSGRIFEITKGGDIKPGRLAEVYLVSWDGVESSAAQRWHNEYLKARQEYINKLKESRWSDSIACHMALLTYDEATIAVLDSAAPKQLKIRL